MNEKMRKAIERQQELADLATQEKRGLTADEQGEFDTLQRSIEELRDKGTLENAGAPNAGGDAATRAVEAERARIGEITAICRDFELDAATFITSGATTDSVRTSVLEEMKKRSAPIAVRVNKDEGDKFRAAASDAMLLRMGTAPKAPAEGAQELRGMSLRDMAIECLAREGESMGTLMRMAPVEMYDKLCRSFYNPTAAFPAILDSAIKKSIEHSYTHTMTTFERFTTKGSLSDFKENKDHAYAIGGAGDFLLVPENGELKADMPRTELLPSRKLNTHGRSFSMSREAFVNDDIGFISEIPAIYASAAKRTINKKVFEILVGNPVLFDGVPFFDAAHKNAMKTGAAPTDALIQSMLLVLGGQTDQFGESIMIPPQAIVLPLGYGYMVRAILGSETISTAGNTMAANPLYGLNVDIVEDPVINALAGKGPAPWFVTGDKSAVKGIQVDYLNGQELPTIRRSEKAGTLGFVWDIYLDWGITVRDFRGVVKNSGVPIASPLA